MKGIVLAGGTATRLFPLTIVTNKHLLPIYDRPMIYYPLDTLAGMGIREVMVIVGGKSVGDIVELLGDGRHFGLDLTYRYQRGALGIAHAIGLARDFIGDDSFCVVLGDNILRGGPLEDTARSFDGGLPPADEQAVPCGTKGTVPEGERPCYTPTPKPAATPKATPKR
jgi:glucose-1-phosphate thymidylyltransferase